MATATKDAPAPAAIGLTSEQLGEIIAATTKAVQAAKMPEILNAKPETWTGWGQPGFPKLTRRTSFCGVPVHERVSTRDEINLFNAITRPGAYGPAGAYRVATSGQGDSSVLDVSVAGVDSMEGRMGMASLRDILQTIVDEQAAAAAA
jgi:hypothetical protein